MCLFCRIAKIFIVIMATLFILHTFISLIWEITREAHVHSSGHNEESRVGPAQHQQKRVSPSQHNRQSTVQPKPMSKCPSRITCAKDSVAAYKMNLTEVDFEDIKKENPDMTEGGSWQPRDCIPDGTLAIVVPLRGREQHFKILLRNLIPFLKLQKKAFTMFAIEQAGDTLFNRASLLNIGFVEAMRRQNYTCYIFHDVDMIPVRICNMYDCSKGARHLGVSRNRNPPKRHYTGYLGGVLALSSTVMKKVNGFTNIMFGWGCEDDEMSGRLKYSGVRVDSFSPDISNYTMVKHDRDISNPTVDRWPKRCLQNSRYNKLDGISTIKYTTTSVFLHALYTKITVLIDGPKGKKEALEYFNNHTEQLGIQFNKPTKPKH